MTEVFVDRIALAKKHNPRLKYVAETAAACDKAGMPLWLGMALYEKETGAWDEQNIYGHDPSGAMYGKGLVTETNYRQFKKLIDAGHKSNGVGPLQATWPPHFDRMERAGLRPWVPADSILYLIGVFAATLTGNKLNPTDAAIKKAGTLYNGSSAYGDRLVASAKVWKAAVPDAPVNNPPIDNTVPSGGKQKFRNGWACGCLIGWVQIAEARLKLAGKIRNSIDFSQLAYSTTTAASKGIHDGGGSADVSFPMDAESIQIMRECGADAHHRPMIPKVWGEHVHLLIRGCPHRSAAADQQVGLFVKGYDGLQGNHKYVGPPPAKVGSWKDAYAKYKYLLDDPIDTSTYIGPYWVDPVKVSSVLFERRMSDGTVVSEAPPRTKISNGVSVATIDGKDYLVTDKETRYALEFLTDKDPNVIVEADIERVLNWNMRRSTAPGDNPPWSARKAKAFQLIKDADASLLFVQESHAPDQRPPGYAWYGVGNVAIGWKTSVWKKVSGFRVDMRSGSDDRAAPVAVMEHIKTGNRYFVSSIHLTNLEGPDHGDGWRLGQSAEWVATVRRKLPELFTGRAIIGGDFNDNNPVLAFFKQAGLLELLDRTNDFKGGNGNEIDNLLTTVAVPVVRARVIDTDAGIYKSASDHDALLVEIGI